MGSIIQKLLLLTAIVTHAYGSLEGLKEITGVKFHQPSAAEMQRAHEAFSSQSFQNKTAIRYVKRSDPELVQLRDVSTAELQQAKALVATAHTSQAAYNKWNMENPSFNNYHHKGTGNTAERRDTKSPPTFSRETLDAIKLVGTVDAQNMLKNGTLPNYNNVTFWAHKPDSDTNFRGPKNVKRANDDSWLSQMQHGSQPFGGDSSYVVWRNVMDYGAVGDGVADDTAAINKAMSDGNRCGANCAGSTVKGAVIYFPFGTYRVSSSIVSYYNTQIVGEINSNGNSPVIEAATTFTGNGVISSDVYLADGTTEWYINTANFYRQIRNLDINLRFATMQNIKGIHWQVGQATSIENVRIYMTDKSSSTQVGIFAENGSGGWFSAISIIGGLYGFLGGNQQYSVGDINIVGAKNCIGIIWDWAWSWSRLVLEDCDVGINLTPPGSNSASPVGSVMIVDSAFVKCPVAILTYSFAGSTGEQGTTVLTLNNVHFVGDTNFIVFPDGTGLVQNVSNSVIQFWQIGDLEADGATHDGLFFVNIPRPEVLTVTDAFSSPQQGSFYRRLKPTYQGISASSILNARALAKGDGVTDDTAALQTMLFYCAKNNCILYVPAGSYMISAPILIPNNSIIVGESWSQFVAYGQNFADEFNPQPMITVGQGESGMVEMQNLLFTSQGALPGLVLVQWNIKAATQGSVGLWDCHFRIGGAKGTNLQSAQCPKLTGSIDPNCIAGSIMLLMTQDSNGYFENMWAWVADHDIDNPASDLSNQINVYFGRGMLIQSQGPSWFRGTASEHSVMYQYNAINASNIYMSIIQTESPYYQGAAYTQAPAPFSPLWNGDPLFNTCGSDTIACNVAWAIIIQWSKNIFIDGAGLYSWFQSYNQDCVNSNTCQQRLVNIYNVGGLLFNHLVTIGSVEVLTPAISNHWNDIKYAADHLQATVYPWWTAIATYLESSESVDLTVDPYPITEGWVSFGDSYAAGIGAGKPYDKVKSCARGSGGYPPILNNIIQFSHNVQTIFQPLSCTGETAQQFIDDMATKQLSQWLPSTSDIGTCSLTGNDLGFGNIVSHCIMGYKSRDECQSDITKAKSLLDANSLIGELVSDVMDKIVAKANVYKPRFVVYWTGYPKFFTSVDSTCDTCWFHEYWYAGEYLTQNLRNQLNQLSVDVNNQIEFAINKYNALLPYPKVVFVSPDKLKLYDGKRFCEKSVSEPLKGSAQNAVAFFYEKGPDNVPGDPFALPKPRVVDAPPDWALSTYNSATCSDSIEASDGNWASEMLCDMAIGISNGSITSQDFLDNEGAGATITANSDGTITITDLDVNYLKMFHPKTEANWHIAQAVTDALIKN